MFFNVVPRISFEGEPAGGGASTPATPDANRPAIGDKEMEKIFGPDDVEPGIGPEEPITPTVEKQDGAAAPADGKEAAADGKEVAAADPMAQLDEFLKEGESAPSDDSAGAKPDAEPAPAASATPEIQQVSEWAKNPDIAKQAVSLASTAFQIDQALAQGDGASALKHFDASAVDTLKKHFFENYQDEFADWYVKGSGNKPDGKPNAAAPSIKDAPEFRAIEAKLDQALSKLSDRERREIEAETRVKAERNQREWEGKFTGYWDELWKRAGVDDADDRLFLKGAVMQSVAADPKAKKTLEGGKLHPIGLAFRDVFKKWSDRTAGAKQASGNGAAPAAVADEEVVKIDPNAGDFDPEKARSSFIRAKFSKIFGE